MNNILKFSFLQIIMVTKPFLCWSFFYAINESAFGHAHIVVPSTGPSLHLPLLSTLTVSYSSVAVDPCLHNRPRPSPSSTEASSSARSLQRDICHRDCLVLHHEFCPSSSSAASVTLLHNTRSRVLLSLFYLYPRSFCSTIHVVEFSWALLPVSSARVIGDRLCHAWPILPASRLVLQHLVLIVNILVLYARITHRRLCPMQLLRYLILISITKAQTSH